ncbi:TRAM domain-containing protein [Acidaminobacter sp. JC074]|uniref:PIN/TRAM domain-containing protein n=1 Tax=Acidaminobacter sp. JC074 TaxID=2530199 RepID=UPI001F0EFA7A|nr:PIN domain-containing protein [Acidaminobacter sp. JC074]MCH4890453.1 TRAM domain-containing protein [Acidaminobacter sp. JC074]
MFKKLIRLLLTLAAMSTGAAIANSMVGAEGFDLTRFIKLPFGEMITEFIFIVLCGLILGLIIFILSPFLIRQGERLAKYIEREITKLPAEQVIVGFLGLISGFLVAFIISGLTQNLIPMEIINNAVSVVLYLFLGYLGVRVALGSKLDFTRIIESFSKLTLSGRNDGAKPKVLDTSVIIDGRILDICKTKFIEGKLIVPEFVLKELRHIADSSDALKRKRGRRGLDVLNKLQNEIDNEVIIDSTDFKDVGEVDIKLLKLAEKLNGMVATHDYNLNKVAVLHGVDVLNINELANAVKPIVLPGEEMIVNVVKEGKENNQGLAYLDDGTMIVIENGKDLIGKTISVEVTTALQTAAGKMIFVKPKKVIS